jgi:tRNA 2-selenouridine synthase
LECIDVLVKRVGHERVNAWKALIAGGDWDAFVQDILEEHYDSAYAAAAAQSAGTPLESTKPLFLENTSDETYERAAKELMRVYDPKSGV